MSVGKSLITLPQVEIKKVYLHIIIVNSAHCIYILLQITAATVQNTLLHPTALDYSVSNIAFTESE